MKIALITSSVPPDPTGGAERQAATTAVRLAQRGHQVTVFARALALVPPGVQVENGVTWVRLATPAIPGLRFLVHVISFLRAWRAQGGSNFDVILAYELMINGLMGGLVRGTCPLVTWIRSEIEVELQQRRKFRVFTPWIAGRSSRVLVQSRSLRERLVNELEATRGRSFADRIAGKIAVVPNGIAVGPEPEYRNRKGLIYVGRLVPLKRVEVIFEAMRLMPAPPTLRILGEGRMEEPWKRLSQDLPVTFEGFVSDEAIRERLNQAKLMVSASRTEGFPNAILEAMERGVPVISTPVGAIPEIIEDGVSGILFPVDDARALADGIHTLCENHTTWEQMARAARAAAEGYAWDAHLDRLQTLLQEAGPAPDHG